MLVYDTLEQARMRLSNSTITAGGRAFFVHSVDQKGALGKIKLRGQYYPIGGRAVPEEATFNIDDPTLNFRRFQVGYLNTEGGPNGGQAVFVRRDTVRQQVQGLTRRTLYGTPGNNLREWEFLSKGFEDMLFDRYPSVQEAMDLVESGTWQSVGISRSFAIGTDKKYPSLKVLLYRGRSVGLAVGSSNPRFIVDKKNQYLKEVLEESGFPFTFEEKKVSNG